MEKQHVAFNAEISEKSFDSSNPGLGEGGTSHFITIG
jgi:hypothetical protein